MGCPVVSVGLSEDVLAAMARFDLPLLPAGLRAQLIAGGCDPALLTARGLLPVVEDSSGEGAGGEEVRIRLRS